jgi:tungstate transport system ATP-binding protein
MKTLVEVNSVVKRYGTTTALELDRLTIREGELYLLSGPNGSGKSSLLNILGLLTRPDQGEVLFAGELVVWKTGSLTRLRRQVTLLHQLPYLFRGTVYDNVAYGLRLRGLASTSGHNVVDEALATVGLEGFGERRHNELSGGEAQRVAMARALVIKPKLLLLDEPFANVDKETSAVLEEVIAALPARGTTIVMSSHDSRQAQRVPCLVIRLNEGQLVEGPVADGASLCQQVPLPC